MLISSFEERLTGHSIEAVEAAVRRFLDGEVPDQNMRFAPSVPEFIREVVTQEEAISIRERPRLPKPVYRPGLMAPFEMTKQKALAANQHRPVIKTDVTFEQFKAMSVAREIPVGASWVACLATVYGPEPVRQSVAAE